VFPIHYYVIIIISDDSKVLFVSADHLIIYSCFGGWDAEQNCPLERTIVNILSRDQELDARDINQLQKIVRQETLSCIPTSMFVTMRPTGKSTNVILIQSRLNEHISVIYSSLLQI